MREKNFGIDEKIDIKLDFMSKYLKNRRNSNSMVDFIMYTNILLDKLFSEEEKRRIKSNRFFVDTKDIKDERNKRKYEGNIKINPLMLTTAKVAVRLSTLFG